MHRRFAFCGIAFVAVTIAVIVGLDANAPTNDSTAAEIVAFYDHGTWRHVLAALALAATTPLLIVFAVELAETASPTASTPWGHVLIGGSILTGAGLAVAALVHFAVADAGDQGLPTGVLQTLNVLDGDSWVAFNAGFGVLMLGAAGCLWSRAGAERWFGRIALVLGILLFVPFADFFALVGCLVWIAAVGILRARTRDEAPAASPVPAA